jgi:hypothetical protein
VKWRFFRHLLGLHADPDAERVYLWHIKERSGPRMALGLATDQWKRTLYDYVRSSADLAASMRIHGFLPQCALPIDPNGELLGGAHRLACAIALSMPSIAVSRLPRMAWAPPWHREWFIEHGMSAPDIARLDDDWEMMHW